MFSTAWVLRLRQTPLSVTVPALAWLVAAVLVFHRLPFGTSQGDEAYYNAMPYAFAIGSRPYVDELGIFQNPGVMLAPLYRLYIAINGSGDGIILFNRYLYFLYSMACSVLAYRVALRLASRSTALSIAALVASYAYFNLFAISYNTAGAFGFFCGVMCTASALLNARPGRMLFVACLLFLSAMFGYPGLLPVVGAYFLIVLAWLFRKTPREARISALKGLAAGGVAALIGLGLLSWAAGGVEGFRRLAGFAKAMGYANQGILARLNIFHLVWERWRWLPFEYLAIFIVLPLACRYLKRGLWVVAVAGAVLYAFAYGRGLGIFQSQASSIGQTVLPVLAPLCVVLNRRWSRASFVMWLIWTPSFMSMVVVSYTSSNNFYAACMGVLGVMFASVLALAAYVEQLAEQNPQYQLSYQLVFVALAGSLFVAQASSMYAGAYSEEADLAKCTARVHNGPSRGLKTGVAIAALLENVDLDLKDVARRYPTATSISIFDDFPAGYVSTRLKPRTFAMWIIWGFMPMAYAQQIATENFASPEQLPDILLMIHQNQLSHAYLDSYLQGHFKPVVTRPEFDYVIWRKVGRGPKRGKKR